MKAGFLVTGIVLFICCAEFHPAKGNTQVQGELQKKAEVVAKEQTQEKAPAKPANKPEETEDNKPKKSWSFKVHGELTNYFVSESRAFFGDSVRHWLETSLRLDGTARYKLHNLRQGFDALRVEWDVKRIHLSEALAEEALCKGK